MGIDTFVRRYIKTKYCDAFSFKPREVPTVCVYDLMKDVKYMPDSVTMLEDAIVYLVNKIKAVLFSKTLAIRTIIVMVDRAPPPVKRMVTHAKRYAKKNVFSGKGGPYLPVSGRDLIPNPWIQFAGNYRLLQRELYPRLFNAFMDGTHIVPGPGQCIILHGFPGYSEWVTVYKQRSYTLHTNDRNEILQVHTWNEATELPITKEQERRDPDLYNRIYVVENVPPSPQWPQGWLRKEEWVEAKNDISEADGAMFFYDHWFQNERILIVCNDGDVFAYGLLYSYERVNTANNGFRNNHIVCLPYKQEKGNEFFAADKIPSNEYVDMNRLYVLVKEDATMKAAGVQDHVLTFVFLMIMAGSDFFKGHLKGIGAEKGIWEPFFSCIDQYTHLVQSSKGVAPSTRTPRTIVLDEDLFRFFVHFCYLEKNGEPLRKRLKRKSVDDISYEELRAHVSGGARAQKDPDYQLPSRNQIRLWGRQVLWNLMYYRNTPFGNQHSPSPFEMWNDLPYFPYIRNPDTGKPEMTEVVSARGKPVDEVFQQHMLRGKRKRRPVESARVKSIVDAFDDGGNE